jgi:PAS domain S-box-containing protein
MEIDNPDQQAMSSKPSAPQKKPDDDSYRSVRKLLIVLIGSVFFIEVVVMDAVLSLTHLSKTGEALLDASLLTLLLFPIFYFLIFRPLILNIAERKKVEAELRIAAVAFEIKDPSLITDAKANIIRANQKFLEKTGYSLEEIVGRNPRMFKSGVHDKKYYENLWKHLLEDGAWSGEIRIMTKGGRILHPFWLTITAVKNEQQDTTHYIGIYNF